MSASPRPATLGALKRAVASGAYRRRSVRDEVRDNLIEKLRRRDRLFPGVMGYDETVIPQLVNAILAKHHFILLGLRGQAKTRLIRALVDLLDEAIPVVPGSEIHDDPLAPISAHGRAVVAAEGDDLPIEWRPRDLRYVEKLATPDVTIADLIGDIDPIKAAASGLQLGSELAMHFGLLPRANRGLFAINELPDLAGRVQVGLFNILQEGDVQIKGFPVRLPLDVMIVFTANPEDYTARGKIITPLKDRIGAEIRTHYLDSRADAMAVTAQESWTDRGLKAEIPAYVREVVEEIAFQARGDRRIDRRSGVSQRLPISVLETVLSNAERRALASDEGVIVPRVTDAYAALPSMTGKLELEYEGELKGAHVVARELIKHAVAQVFDGHFVDADVSATVHWFENGGSVLLGDGLPASALVVEASKVPGLMKLAEQAGLPAGAPAPLVASAVDFVLEGLYSQKRIGRTEAGGYVGNEPVRRRETAVRQAPAIALDEDDDEPGGGGGGPKKKRYYN
jgi:magnesium chelatase subunit I